MNVVVFSGTTEGRSFSRALAALGAAVIRNSDSTYVELGVVKTVPTPGIFLAAAVVLLLLVPFVLALRKQEETSCQS